MSTSDHAKLIRLLTIMRLLNSRKKGITVHDIAQKAGVDTRTVYRYFKSFEELGLLISKTNSPEGILYRLDKTNNEYANVIDFIPPLSSEIQKQISPEKIRKANRPTWIIEDTTTKKAITFESLSTLLIAFPVIKANTLYRRLLKANSTVIDKYRVTKATHYTRLK